MHRKENVWAITDPEARQDQDDERADEIYRLQIELSDDLYDAYLTGNQNAINEVEGALLEPHVITAMLDRMRVAMTKECQRPIIGRGCELYTAYRRQIESVCMTIARNYDTAEKIQRARRHYGI